MQFLIAIDHPSWDSMIDNLQCCLQSVHDWILRNGLTISPYKTELILLGSASKLAHLGYSAMLNVAGWMISPVSSVNLRCRMCNHPVWFLPDVFQFKHQNSPLGICFQGWTPFLDILVTRMVEPVKFLQLRKLRNYAEISYGSIVEIIKYLQIIYIFAGRLRLKEKKIN